MRRILKQGENCWGIYEATRFGILVDGRNYFRAFYHAALKAERYILITGWQFDSSVKLLRGKDLREAEGDVSFIDFLTGLCEKKPELRIYILAWDYSAIFALEREWFQEWIFAWSGHHRMHFIFDNRHPVGGTHHQKFVVIDGRLVFVGGIDICSFRWDDRSHLWDNPDRVEGAGARRFDPYHDLQAYLCGPICSKFTELFEQRWTAAGGVKLGLAPREDELKTSVGSSEAIRADRVAISRTLAPTLLAPQEPIREIRSLYFDAIEAAESLIYMENQYLSSRAVVDALLYRMRQPGPKPDIVMILPKQPQALSEKVVHGVAQVQMLRLLREAAAETGTRFGVYYPAVYNEEGKEKMVYVHSKLLIVDDRFLSVGSANTTNRSMGLDTEVNVSCEAESPRQRRLIASVKNVRVSLLMEHSGLCGWKVRRRLRRTGGLVSELDALSQQSWCRLRRHPIDNLFSGSDILKDITPGFVDAEEPLLDEKSFEAITNVDLLFDGIVDFNEWLLRKSKDQSGAVRLQNQGKGEVPAKTIPMPVYRVSRLRYLIWVILTLGLVIAAWLFRLPRQ